MAKKKKQASHVEPPQRRRRRGVEQLIADLEAKIAGIKEREARKQAKADPALRHASAALRSIDKALAEVEDSATEKALNEARSTLATCLGAGGGVLKPSRTRRSASEREDLAAALLAYVRSNPGQRGEQIAAALGTDTTAMRPAMKQLIAEGKVATEGQRRGMTYAPN